MTQRDKLIELLDTNCGYVDEIKAEELADRLLENGVVVLPCQIGDTLPIEADIMGCNIGKMPYKVVGISVDLYADWGGATQQKQISIDEASAALEGLK